MKTLKPFKQLLAALALTIVLPVSNALAVGDGGVSSGGGDSVTQNNIIELLDLAEAKAEYLDIQKIINENGFYFTLLKFGRNYSDTKLKEALGREIYGLFRCFFDISIYGKTNQYRYPEIDPSNEKYKRCIKSVPNSKELLFVFSNTPLEELNDEGVISLKEITPSKRQIARQDLDANVAVYKNDFENLRNDNPEEKIKNQQALIVHEILVRMVIQYNISEIKKNGTSNIRRLTRLLISTTYGEVVPARALQEAFLKLGVHFSK